MKRSPLTRRSRIKAANPERRKAKFDRNFGERAAAIRAMPCVADSQMFRLPENACQGDRQAAHVRARGMGGAKGSRFELVCMCCRHHAEAGEWRTSQRAKFEAKYSLDLQCIAAENARQLTEQGYP